jgi:outer membrane protein OmpU
MKKVLLTTTALVMTAGVASADVTLGGNAKTTFGNWGGGGAQSWASDTNATITMSGEASGVAYSASLTADQGGNSAGAISMSSNGLSFAIGTSGDAGEADDEAGDLTIGYTGGGATFGYVENTATGKSKIDASYAAGDLTLTYSTNDTDNVNTVGASFSAGDLAVSLSGADSGGTWDASAAYTIGASTVTLATDEGNVASIAVATTVGGVTLGATAKNDANKLSVGYSMGDITMSYAYSESAHTAGTHGDDAGAIMSVAYDLGGITITGSANDSDEVKVEAAFTF